MNTDNNARFKETDEKIIRAYGRLVQKKLPAQVTVSDVCREAGIHRTTFYGHYCDIVALEEHVERNQFVRLLGEFQLEDDWDMERGMLAITSFCKKYRAILKKHMDGIIFRDTVWLKNPDILKNLEEKYNKFFHCESEAELMYHQNFYWSGTWSVIIAWIERDCLEPEEEITKIICDILRRSTDGIPAR